MNSRVALLRGINVGGNRKIAMADLRAFMQALGFADATTLLQTGNVVFESRAAPARLEALLEREAGDRLGLSAEFFVRTADEWRGVVAGNPFPREAASDPSHLVVVCLKAAVTPARLAALRAAIRGPEVVEARGRHAYLVYPAGIGTSKLTAAVLDAKLGTRGTARNWNTVVKLAGLLDG
ncbi:MAG: DUF1697 domain-containing protein [Gemmatimonadaceae bacterium]